MRKCQMLVKNRGDNEGKGEKGKGKHPLVARVSYRRENPVEVGSGKRGLRGTHCKRSTKVSILLSSPWGKNG